MASESTALEAAHADLCQLSHDQALVDKIMKKRQEEMARRTRLLDTRRFRTGVPHDVLDEQVACKKNTADAAKAADDYHDRYRMVSDQVAQVCESIAQEATRERQKQVTQYSLNHCRKEQRREYHLSDPNAIKRERPARDGDNDPRLGPSSIQCFEGEDFLAKQRKEQATKATREWLKYQTEEKRERCDRENKMDRLYHDASRTANEMRGLCEKSDVEEQQAEKKAEAIENRQLAVVHHARQEAAKRTDAKAALTHMQQEMSSERIMELDDYKLGVDGRLLKGEYKRFSVAEEEDVYATNARLILEKQARRRSEESRGAMQLQHNYSVDMVLHTVESAKSNAEKQRRMEIDEFNKALVKKKRNFDLLQKKAYMSYEHVEPYFA